MIVREFWRVGKKGRQVLERERTNANIGRQEANRFMFLKSVGLFILAGLFEIGGGYLVWQWWRNNAHVGLALAGAVVLFLYGIVPTYQPANFGRVYAAYGGWFVILSLLWGWIVDHIQPDRFDVIGATLCLLGVAIIMYWPR